MGIKKKIVETDIYTCDANGCGATGEDPKDFTEELPIQLGTAVKKKVVLCMTCRAKFVALQKLLLTPEEAKPKPVDTKDYDPQADPLIKALSPAERDKNYQAKLWAWGPDSTIAKSNQPASPRGKVAVKIMVAYEIWLREQQIKEEAAASATA